MDSSQEILIRNMASTRTETSYDARNMLEMVFGEHYPEDIPGSDEEYVKYVQPYTNGFLEEQIITIYPNPNSGNFTILYSQTASENSSIYVSDLTGKVLAEYALQESDHEIKADLTQLQNGTYLIGIKNHNTLTLCNKIVIIK